jgi:predicted transglutaminase-like cysteine proteinase
MRFAVSKVQGLVSGSASRRPTRGRRALTFLALAALGAATAAQAQTLASLPSEVGARVQGEAKPIAAWVTFCQSYAAECAVDRTEPARISLTPATWATIVSVNRRVNKAVEPMTDQDHLHVADRWDLAEDGIGDCEDFQLLKRHLLAEAGLPRRAMRMTVAQDRLRVHQAREPGRGRLGLAGRRHIPRHHRQPLSAIRRRGSWTAARGSPHRLRRGR